LSQTAVPGTPNAEFCGFARVGRGASWSPNAEVCDFRTAGPVPHHPERCTVRPPPPRTLSYAAKIASPLHTSALGTGGAAEGRVRGRWGGRGAGRGAGGAAEGRVRGRRGSGQAATRAQQPAPAKQRIRRTQRSR